MNKDTFSSFNNCMLDQLHARTLPSVPCIPVSYMHQNETNLNKICGPLGKQRHLLLIMKELQNPKDLKSSCAKTCHQNIYSHFKVGEKPLYPDIANAHTPLFNYTKPNKYNNFINSYDLRGDPLGSVRFNEISPVRVKFIFRPWQKTF